MTFDAAFEGNPDNKGNESLNILIWETLMSTTRDAFVIRANRITGTCSALWHHTSSWSVRLVTVVQYCVNTCHVGFGLQLTRVAAKVCQQYAT